ncbi:HigA family addiction module antitoxin [uncultured Roseibium sp.]|uniref:HigA family addiction module antitoxin n=1 Tax=uncultured Roseibium sp. TaxID=1936171 RepID=UPI00260BF130|nr:HigA family addiction module antitoxin [uncultured Roseibium sp.]
MSDSKNRADHPGAYVKKNVIPENVTVKDAAKLLGVGRPALSNFLNGRASLSVNMAARLDKVFGANQKKLLDMQSDFDAAQQSAEEQPALSRGYMPTVVTTKAADIALWANNVAARSELPALLRRLVNSTGFELTGVDFPAFDNAQRKGWDGYVEAGAPTQWIPKGNSGWEFGCDKTPKTKAEDDYTARVGSVDAKHRAQTTFVFVTPRNWHGKKEWAEDKKALGDWKEVKAYDASDIEQWLEQSAPVQIWLAERLGKPTTGYRSLSQCWNSWSPAGDYTLSPSLFAPAINSYAETFSRWLDREPGQPFIVAADSRDEALAFLSCLIASDKLSSRRSGDDAIVFDSAEAVRQLSTASPGTFIAVADRPEIERELFPLFKKFHCIIIRPRNAVDADPDVSLDLLRSEDFENALKDMGIEKDAADRLAHESARSPTILRRRLSHPGTTRTPEWVQETEMARKLIPAVLIGAWQASSKADREIVKMLAGTCYENFEAVLPRALLFDDPPLWSLGQFRGVTSKIDALFAIASTITEKDLRDFLIAAEYVLYERDPALDLPEEDRWAAGMYGKVRDHSAALRSGVCETLVLLAVHGNTLFFNRLGFDAEGEIEALIRRLLSPLDLEKFHSQNNDLPNYAEAAPDVFLELVSNDLRSDNPVVMGLLKPFDNSIFGSSPARTGLLWGLENLAWNPANLLRVVDILARLCSREIDDNWVNKPEETLKSLFRSWLPQTAATLEERIKALDYLAKQYSDVGWRICVAQFRGYSEVGHYNHRPKWRSDASGAGQAVTVGERNKFVLHAIELTLSWPTHNEKTLGDLLERLSILSDEHQAAVWRLVENWAENSANEDDKAKLREHIRKHTLSRRSRKRGISKENAASAASVLEKLLPDDLVKRHGWLFASHWVEPSYQEYQDEDFDHQRRNQLIHDQRLAALKEIWKARDFDGICALLTNSGAPIVVGGLMGEILKKPKATETFVLACLSNPAQALQLKLADCLQGLLRREDKANQLSNIFDEVKQTLGNDAALELFLSMPFNETTWRMMDNEPEEFRKSYWQRAYAHWADHSPEEINEITDRLLEVNRPAAAFNVLHLDWKKIETSRLKRLLHALVNANTETMARGSLSAYDISEAMAELNRRPGVTVDEMAQLEFIYLRVLEDSEHGIPNLEKQISETPSLYVQALAFAFKRSDDGEDPEEFRVAPERVDDMARSAYELLDRMSRIPGTAEDRAIHVDALKDWLKDVRIQAADIARADIADDRIGQLLSKSPEDEDGVWPCRAVCEAMEWMSSANVGSGFSVGTRNSRGVYWRGEGGNQERELANKYRDWGRKLGYEFPYVASVLYGIADSYEREAQWQDTDAKVRRRLRGW